MMIDKCPYCGNDKVVQGCGSREDVLNIWIGCFECNTSFHLNLPIKTKWNVKELSKEMADMWRGIKL